MIVAQITDTHITAPGTLLGGVVDTTAYLRAAVDHVNSRDPKPEVALLTGDLVDAGMAEEYGHLRALLAPLDMPYYPIPGNHDGRAAMREAFADHAAVPGDGFIQYVVEAGPLRLIALDTHAPGEPGGRLCAARLDWLAARLDEEPRRPTVIFMHHPPIATGVAYMDAMGLYEGGAELGALLARHDNIEAVLCGHVHRAISARWNGTMVTVMPSTAHQVGLTLRPTRKPGLVFEPPCVGLHWWSPDAHLVSHVSYVTDHPLVPRAP